MQLEYSDIVFDGNTLVKAGILEIFPGEIAVIKGKNGAGKSSLAKNLCFGEKNPDADMVFVSQNNDAVASELSVLENISMSTEQEYNRMTEEKVCAFGFGELMKKKSRTLSGGEKRLVELLRGFCSDAKILIIDEPTNDLDYVTVERISEILKRLKCQKEIIVISHDDRMFELADRIYEIREKILTKIPGPGLNRTGEIQKENRNRSELIIKAMFHPNPVSVLLLVFLLLVAGKLMLTYRDAVDEEYVTIRDNQINVFSLASVSNSSDNFTVTYPSEYLSLLDNPGLLRQWKLMRMKDHSDKIGIVGLTYRDNDSYSVYPMEYYDAENKKSYRILDCYLQGEYGLSSEEGMLDTSDYFEQPDWYRSDELYEFDLETYRKYVEQYEQYRTEDGKALQLVSAIITLKSENAKNSFFQTDICKILTEGQVYVIYNELTDCVRKAENYQSFFKEFLIFVFFAGLVLILDEGYWLLVLRYSKSRILVLKNYGYSQSVVEKTVQRQCNCRIPKLLVGLLIVPVNVWIFRNSGPEQMNYYWSLFFAGACSVEYSVNNFTIKKYVESSYRWFI